MSDLLFDSYFGGILFVLIGLILFRHQLKEDASKYNRSSMFQGYLGGWAAAIFLIVGGIVSIILRMIK